MAQHGFATRPEEVEAQPPQQNLQIDPKALQPERTTQRRGSAPIPGESLTSEPGNMPFEHPPQFVKLEEASEFVWDQLNKRDNTLALLAMLDKQIPVDGLVNTILSSGFATGKWSPDLAILMAQPVAAMIIALGKSAGIDMRMKTKDKSKSQENLEAIINLDTGTA